MATIVTRAGKGSPLTHAEVDANFTNLNDDKLEVSSNLSDLDSAAEARENLLPSYTGNEGKVLAVNTGETDVEWIPAGGGASYPDQTGNDGKFLQTDGTDVSWQAVDALPSQTGKKDYILSTDGTNPVWVQDFSKLNLMGL